MRFLAAVLACTLLVFVLIDSFETVVIARRTQRTLRITRAFYKFTWAAFCALALRIRSGRKREHFLAVYGPTSLVLLLGCWATGLIMAFALLHWSVGLRFNAVRANFFTDFYFSAATLFTLAPNEPWNMSSKYLSVLEAGIGLSLLGLVIGYLPVLYQSYSDREVQISLLDARAGSPPTAAELIRRQGTNPARLEKQFSQWEKWAAELLETHLSYPMLAYFRSQHTNQSWLAALSSIIDASAIVMLASDTDLKRQAELTFAMGRHALVDLATIFKTAPRPNDSRLPAEVFSQLTKLIAGLTTALQPDRLSRDKLNQLREMYEPFANALGWHFLMALPPWVPATQQHDNWQVTSWGHIASPFAVSDPFLVEAEEDEN
ncbi:MAG: hypothetical protein JWN74_2419 [Acidobacteriaceae bacterium]|nr:hypothetical protein [Acidobacteriaceae bacterium]